jgi:ABC-type cobalamin/Fe3+-siderophores transport system ATPase subunit
MKNSKKYINSKYKLIVIGPNNSGKSTILEDLTGMKGCFLKSSDTETSFRWIYME